MSDIDRRIRALEKEIARELRNNPTGQALRVLRDELDELLAGQAKEQAGLWEKLIQLLGRRRGGKK